MTRRAQLSWGTSANPRDPRTNATMTEANWQRYMADFVVAVRAAFPVSEIVHDVQWWRGDAGAEIARGLAAASFVAIEKGFTDPVVTPGSGTYGFQTLTAFVERRQALIAIHVRHVGQLHANGATAAFVPPAPPCRVHQHPPHRSASRSKEMPPIFERYLALRSDQSQVCLMHQRRGRQAPESLHSQLRRRQPIQLSVHRVHQPPRGPRLDPTNRVQ